MLLICALCQEYRLRVRFAFFGAFGEKIALVVKVRAFLYKKAVQKTYMGAE
jgi:hypothetical protein